MSEFSVVRTSSYTELNVATLSAVNATIVNATIDNATITNATITNATIDFLTIDLTIIGFIKVSDGIAGAPSYTFTSDPDTGMYRPASNQLGFSTGGSIKLGVSSAGISVQEGTAAIPSINFGLASTDTDTGMFQAGPNTIGLSVNGIQTATIAASGTAPAGMIPGLNIGTTVNVAGLRRVSLTSTNSWEDGNVGNSAQLMFTPCDFMVANPAPGIGGGIGALATDFINMANDNVGWDNAGGGRYGNPQLVTHSTVVGFVSICATKLIPKGFQITDTDTITIHASANIITTLINVSIRTIDDPGQLGNAFLGSGYTFNDPAPMTGLGTGPGGGTNLGDGKTMIILYIEPGAILTAGNGGIWGATITMKRI